MTFHDAYIKLTAFYVLIIMVISLLFSVWVYNEATREFKIAFDTRIGRLDPEMGLPSIDGFAETKLQEARARVTFNLFTLNVIVLVLGAGASYLLARRTMQPIEEALKAKDRFTADASHELRTPLAAMKAEIEVALRDTKRTPAETNTLLKSNLEEIDRMSSLAEGLLVLTNNATVHRAPVKMHEIVSKMSQRFTPLAEAKQISLECTTTPVTIESESVHIEKILGILIDNAIKYSPKNTVVEVTLTKDNGDACVSVTDHGHGIKSSELPHIFERFYRADASRSKERVAGHGLGLSIAQKLATAIGAELTATSAPGRGSTFSVKLPL